MATRMQLYREKMSAIEFKEEGKKKKKPFKLPEPTTVFNGRIESFNLDDVRMKKLHKLLELQDVRKKQLLLSKTNKLEGETKEQATIRKIEETVKSKKREFISFRLTQSGCLKTTILAKEGEEYLLRMHLESGNIAVDYRDSVTGRTMLIEAVAGVCSFPLSFCSLEWCSCHVFVSGTLYNCTDVVQRV